MKSITPIFSLFINELICKWMKDMLNLKIKAIAANIRHTREGLNYTQEYLAAKLGISQNAYSKIELGYTKITVERLFQIAAILEIEVAELIDTEKIAAA
ncbi:transcriptional regulator with XRE-family HTH domain [Mucilaginibacter sp. SG538B]|nr:transcriptional regulator with XRE-family HTH domain [Mucilaginibacter sp. SG538B]